MSTTTNFAIYACPFCHGTDVRCQHNEFDGDPEWSVFCGRCDAAGPGTVTKAEAIAYWNRATNGPLAAEPSADRALSVLDDIIDLEGQKLLVERFELPDHERQEESWETYEEEKKQKLHFMGAISNLIRNTPDALSFFEEWREQLWKKKCEFSERYGIPGKPVPTRRYLPTRDKSS